jgi:hypothetical protein
LKLHLRLIVKESQTKKQNKMTHKTTTSNCFMAYSLMKDEVVTQMRNKSQNGSDHEETHAIRECLKSIQGLLHSIFLTIDISENAENRNQNRPKPTKEEGNESDDFKQDHERLLELKMTNHR